MRRYHAHRKRFELTRFQERVGIWHARAARMRVLRFTAIAVTTERSYAFGVSVRPFGVNVKFDRPNLRVWVRD